MSVKVARYIFGRFQVFTALSLVLVASIACASDSGPDTPQVPVTDLTPSAESPTATQPSGQTQPTTRATQTAAPAASTSTPVPTRVSNTPSGSVTMALFEVFAPNAVEYLSPGGRPSGPVQTGIIRETLFHFRDGDVMTPNLVDTWSIDHAGTVVSMTLKPGIPWYAPRAAANMDFGTLDALDVVEYLNRTNAAINPDCTGVNCGDFAALFGEARVVDDLTLEVPLRVPVFWCLPLSEFGCQGAGAFLTKVSLVDEMGREWAVEHEVTNGPFVQGECIALDRCTVHAVENHWRKTSEVAEVTALHMPDANTQIAAMLGGNVDFIGPPFELVPDLVRNNPDRLQWIDMGQFVGQSLIFAGNLWEEFHAISGEPLNPWDNDPYEKDYPWIGDPWQETHPENVRYEDTDNPPGMTDMEQARLVRLALSYAIDRESINRNVLQDLGELLYSEYMGPQYPGWDPERTTGAWDSDGNRIEPSGTIQSVPWKIDHSLDEANRLLDLAGYPRDGSGVRSSFGKITFDGGGGSGELGANNIPISDAIASDWSKLGIEVEYLSRFYPRDISPQLRQRQQVFPVLKNGDVHSNNWPLDFPMPITDSSATRPGWGVGFESKPAAKWYFDISAERDRTTREAMHLDWVDYSLFWVQYVGVYQAAKGTLASPRIESWPQPGVRFFWNIPSHFEFLRLSD